MLLLKLATNAWNSPTITTWGSLCTKLLGLSILLPLALNRLAVEEASLWFLFSAILSIQMLVDFGFAPTFVRMVAYANSKPFISDSRTNSVGGEQHCLKFDSSSIDAVIGTMRRIYGYLGLVSLLLACFGGSVLVAKSISQTHDQLLSWLAWSIIIFGGAAGLRGGMFSAYLQGMELIAVFRKWEILTGFISVIAMILALTMGGGLLGLAITSQLGVLLNIFINRQLAIKASTSDAWTSPIVSDAKVIRTIWPAAWRSGFGILITFGTIQGVGVIYAQLASPSDVAAFLFAQRLIQYLGTFSGIPFYSQLPLFSRLYAEGQERILIAKARTRMLLSNWILVMGILIIGSMGERLLSLIDSKTNFVDAPVWWLMGIALLFERIGAMHLQLYSTTNNIVWHIANGVSGAIMIIAIPFAYSWFGVLGLPLSIILGYAIFYVPYSLFLNYQTFCFKLDIMEVGASIIPVLLLSNMFISAFYEDFPPVFMNR